MYQIRTDLALETQEKMQEDKVELKGILFSEEHVNKNLTISTVVIETENGVVDASLDEQLTNLNKALRLMIKE